MLGDIEDIIDWEDAGFTTDWNCYPLTTMQLVRQWRLVEKEINRLQTQRFQAVIRGFLKE